ncbi:acyl-CoA dehydrogenase family protein [Micromonospora sp. NPDC005113]
MFEHELPAELADFRKVVRTFIQREIAPLEEGARRNELMEIPRDAIAPVQKKARSYGLWCFETPEPHGGVGLDAFAAAVILEEASRHTYSSPDVGNGAFGYDPPNVLLAAPNDLTERLVRESVDGAVQWAMGISEPSGGSDPARSIQTTAVKRDGTWVLNGRKMWTSRADVAKYALIFARTSPGRNGISAFVVELPNPALTVRRVPVIRDHHTTEVLIEDLKLPAGALLGETGQGFALAQKWLNRGRIRIAAQSLGPASLALEMAAEYAAQRSTFGRPLASRQMVQQMIVDSYMELSAARLVLWEAARRDDEGLDARANASMAKVMCTEAAYRAVDNAIQIFGGMGVSREMPLEHWLRSLRVARIVEGPSEVHRMVLARTLLGKEAISS